MRTILALSLLAAVLTSISAYADETTPEQKEEAYQLLCVPGSDSEKALPESKRAEAAEFRTYFQEFLRNPEPLIFEFKKLAMFGGGDTKDSLGGAILFGIMCGTTEVLKDEISARGCKGQKGEALSAAQAATLCAPLLDKVREKK